MRKREGGDIETIRAAHQLIARRDELRHITETGTYHDLAALLESIDSHVVTQASEDIAAQAATQASLTARERLQRFMAIVDSAARHQENEFPEMRAIRLPREYLDRNAFIALATAMASEVAKRRKQFLLEDN